MYMYVSMLPFYLAMLQFLLLYRFSVKSTVILLPLLGITWIIGLFAVNQNTIIFAWIFTILNSLQVHCTCTI